MDNSPNESGILQRIFDLIIQGPVVLPPPIDNPRKILAQVCRTWRHVVTSTPRYWNFFDLIQLDVQHPEGLFRLAQIFLRRSGGTIPLTIRFQGFLLSNVARRMFKLVMRSYGYRLWCLSCIITKKQLGKFFGADSGDFPFLKYMEIEVRGRDGRIATRARVKGSMDLSGFQRTPSLRHVAIRNLNGVHSADMRLPWSRLTRIDLGNTPTRPKKFIKIMGKAFLLEDGVFCIDFARFYCGKSATLQIITIPLLRRLHLKLIRPSPDAHRILRKLRMPSLEGLWLEREEVGQPCRDMALYETLLARLNAPLKHITVTEHSFPTTTWFLPRLNDHSPRLVYQELDGVFRSAHYLTSLYLCPGVFIHPLALEKLASGEFLPFLEKLAASSVSGWDIVWMVQQRNSVSTRPESGPSSNSASLVGPMSLPIALNYIRLFVMGFELDGAAIRNLKDALMGIRLSGGFSFLYADIPRQEASISQIGDDI